MGLFARGKKSTQQQKTSKYLVNIKDKKFRKYLDERFDSVLKREDVAKIMEELQWTSMKSRIESMPRRTRFKMLKYMTHNVNKLAPDVKQNFVRYMAERYGVSVSEKR